MSYHTCDSFLTVKCISRYLPTHCLVATVVQEPVWIIETRTVLAPALMTWLRFRIQSSIKQRRSLPRRCKTRWRTPPPRESAQVRAGKPQRPLPLPLHRPSPFRERSLRPGSQPTWVPLTHAAIYIKGGDWSGGWSGRGLTLSLPLPSAQSLGSVRFLRGSTGALLELYWTYVFSSHGAMVEPLVPDWGLPVL